MIRFLKKHRIDITIIIIILIVITSIFIRVKLTNNKTIIKEDIIEEKEELIEEKKEDEDEEIEVYIDIKGEVINPGVYKIEKTKRVIDVVNISGGFTDNADTSLINLAKKIEDSMVIIIYSKEEIEKINKEKTIEKEVDKKCICPSIKNDACLNKEGTISDNKVNEISETKININTSSIIELQKLEGIGESKAKAIVEYRDNNGIFEKIEDIMKVPGIGTSMYEKIKDYITV